MIMVIIKRIAAPRSRQNSPVPGAALPPPAGSNALRMRLWTMSQRPRLDHRPRVPFGTPAAPRGWRPVPPGLYPRRSGRRSEWPGQSLRSSLRRPRRSRKLFPFSPVCLRLALPAMAPLCSAPGRRLFNAFAVLTHTSATYGAPAGSCEVQTARCPLHGVSSPIRLYLVNGVNGVNGMAET